MISRLHQISIHTWISTVKYRQQKPCCRYFQYSQATCRKKAKDKKRKNSLNSHPKSFPMLPLAGLEPARCYPLDFESSASAIPPLRRVRNNDYYTQTLQTCQHIFYKKISKSQNIYGNLYLFLIMCNFNQ